MRCRVLSFLDSAYFDHVCREKAHYDNPAIELVAEVEGSIVGLIDIEYEREEGKACYLEGELGGVVWHLAVLPEYRNRGISTTLLAQAIELLKKEGVKRLEAWTRDDKWVNDWYENRGFVWKEAYLHVFAEGEECSQAVDSRIQKLFLCSCYGHYIGGDKEEVMKKLEWVHECNLYELCFTAL